MNSLRFDIRAAVQDAEGPLTTAEIHGSLKRTVSRKAVSVTVSQMRDSRQLRRKRAPKGRRVQGTMYVYGTGPEAVVDTHGGRQHKSAFKGFMEMARDRDAKKRAKRLSA